MKYIVTIGGGTGSFNVLAALRSADPRAHLAAIVSMADDGGSTGLLRDQYGVLPPGDIRRALVALSHSSGRMRDLFNFRFKEGGLNGHSFGNLFIAALEKTTGSFAAAVREASNILNIDGNVAPVTLDNVRLLARLSDGTIIRGETNIDIPRLHSRRAPIQDIWLEPQARINPEAARIIKHADLIVIGPGDIYTSIVPNLLVKGVREAIKKSKAKKVYIANLMTKRGETDGWMGDEFFEAMERYLGPEVLDYAIFNNRKPPAELAAKYRREGAEFVKPPGQATRTKQKTKFVLANLMETRTFVRHGPKTRLAKLLLSLAK